MIVFLQRIEEGSWLITTLFVDSIMLKSWMEVVTDLSFWEISSFFFLCKSPLDLWKFGWKKYIKVVIISSNVIADYKQRLFSLAVYLRREKWMYMNFKQYCYLDHFYLEDFTDAVYWNNFSLTSVGVKCKT